MKKMIAVAGLLALAACGKKDDAMPAMDSTAAAAPYVAPADSIGSMPDSTMARDTAHQM